MALSQSKTMPASFGTALQHYMHEETSTPSPTRRTTRSRLQKESIPTPSPAAPPPSSKTPKPTSSQPPSTSTSGPLKRPPSTHPTSPTPKKRKRTPSGYAPPTKYAHIPNLLTDSLAPNLITIFIGVNPGLRTATTGHAYSHPSNLFWKLCHKSGCTPRLCHPSEDHNLPNLYALGHTNIVSRATKDASELSKEEMDEGVAVLEEKVRKWRPESVCVVGKGIWESMWRVRKGRGMRREEFRYGWQGDGERMGGGVGWEGAWVFVATTTSGLAAGMRPKEKEEVWRGLGEWAEGRRRERGIGDKGGVREICEWRESVENTS